MTPEAVISKVFGMEQSAVTDTTSSTTVAEWDSMGHVILIAEIEATYGISLSLDDVLAMTSVAAVKRVLSEYGARW